MTYHIHESTHWHDHRPYHSSNLRYASHAYPASPSPALENQQPSSRFPSLSQPRDAYSHDLRDADVHTRNNIYAHDHNHGHNQAYATPPPLPLRSSSLHSQDTIVSSNRPLPPLPTTSPTPSLTRSRRKSKPNRSVTVHTSPITSLTTSQFQHNIFPILQGIASQMYRARVWKEANKWDGEGDVLSVKAPTMGQVLRRAEKVGWNLEWEGWSW